MLPRGKNEKEDLANEKQLLADPKERAEHIMLAGLARNDIGRVCEFDRSRFDLMIIERYSHVMHIVSDVEGKLDQNFSPYDLMRATFPQEHFWRAQSKSHANHLKWSRLRGGLWGMLVTFLTMAIWIVASPFERPC